HANFGGVHRGAAVTTNQDRTFLAVTNPAADLAGIKRADEVAIGLAHHEKAKRGSLRVHGIEMHGHAAHFRQREANNVSNCCDMLCFRRSGGRARINKFGREGEYDGKAQKGRCETPSPTTAILVLSEALFSGVRGRIERRAAASATIPSASLISVEREPFAQYHNRSDAENDNKEEIFVADDGTDRRHFLLARWKPPGLAQFMQPCQGELKRDNHQNRAGGGEKAAQRNPKRALKEKQSYGDGHRTVFLSGHA